MESVFPVPAHVVECRLVDCFSIVECHNGSLMRRCLVSLTGSWLQVAKYSQLAREALAKSSAGPADVEVAKWVYFADITGAVWYCDRLVPSTLGSLSIQRHDLTLACPWGSPGLSYSAGFLL